MMGIIQGLGGVIMLLGGGGTLACAIIGIASNTINSELGSGLALSGVIAIILGFILVKTN